MAKELFKTTAKGTKLPIMLLKGKEYLLVAHRLVWFREEHPEGSIMTEVSTNGETSDAKATVAFKLSNGEYRVVSTGHKRETESNFPDHREKAETGAIGRALAIAGYGTQFEPELDEQERIVDAPIKQLTEETPPSSSATPSEKPLKANVTASKSNGRSDTPPANGSQTVITNMARVIVAKKLKTWDELKAGLKEKWGVDKKEDLTPPQAIECQQWLQAQLQ